MNPRCAVMGNPIAHSISPLIHELFAKQFGFKLHYEKILIEPETFAFQVQDFFSNGGLGLNITSPAKPWAYNLSQVQTVRCRKAQVANTLWMIDNQLHADNTDGIGLVRDLARFIDIESKEVLILGAGGVVAAILADLLAKKPKTVTVSNRTMEKAEALKAQNSEIAFVELGGEHKPYDLILHASSAGTKGESYTFPECLFESKPFCYDLSYKLHAPTPFVLKAQEQGCEATDGVGMLVEQAAEAFIIWHGLKPDTSTVLKAVICQKT